MNWLATPLSGGPAGELAPWVYWHARLMVLAWGVVLPIGALAARFFKIGRRQDWPRELDPKAWWRAHFWGQNLGFALMLVGLALAVGNGPMASGAALAHHLLGWSVVALGSVQFVSGWLRGDKGGPTAPRMRGDHYDMTPRRVVFEHIHKRLGWVAVALTVPTVALGLALADAPRGMAIGLGLWALALTAAFVKWQREGRSVDTYQAIWGPDPSHPGNRRRPIGWGVRLPERNESSRR